ncbi:MAG TPA: NAD(P)/FAD-dependent oxidoreductase, partial [Sphingomonas sp.]|nr:NAD(P)/FAD-dependent oxidoreductase [Sphingomonas sp.]
MAMEHFDVIVVGAGLSGVGAGYHLQTRCPNRSYVILEGREALGGTWDLFRYPGVRSDSDMHTLGFAFHPWTQAKSMADGPAIRDYIAETARTYGVDRHIRYRHRIERAAWSTPDARWTVEGQGPDGPIAFTCNFLAMCSGYYDYAKGYAPDFAGIAQFEGRVVHPQFWPDDLDHAGKRIVVIGSGATAVTLVPEMAKTAASVTMLQRSPTYVVSRPAQDAVANWLRAKLPAKAAYGITRWKNVLVGMFFFRMARSRPAKVKARMIGMVRDHLGPEYDVATHFTPRYNPWDQRVCLVPDADLFGAIKAGRADVVTDTIDTFVAQGVRLSSGRTLPADIVVTATGLELKMAGGVTFTIDGAPVDLATKLHYKGMMYADVPNLATTFGYTNASWTLKADLT